MKRLNLCALLVCVCCLASWVVQAQDTNQSTTTTQGQVEKTTQGQVNKVIPTAEKTGPSQLCSMCFTCGGNYPIFSGAIPLPAGSMPIERQGGCDDPLVASPDTFPYLCCSF